MALSKDEKVNIVRDVKEVASNASSLVELPDAEKNFFKNLNSVG